MNSKSLWTTLCIALAMQLGLIDDAQSQPTGAAAYGTREPTTCPARTFARAPTPSEAMALVRCDAEGYTSGYIYLVTNLTVQMGKSRAYQYYADGSSSIDVSAPVYPIQGGFVAWQCGRRDAQGSPSCVRTDTAHATGTCYKNTFGEWHCAMKGAGIMTPGVQPPPPNGG